MCRVKSTLVAGIIAGLCLFPRPGFSQATVTGVSDRGVYTDGVTLSVTGTAGFDTTALLDGSSIPLGLSRRVNAVEYHELEIWGTNRTTAVTTNFVLRFNVVSAEREGTENGLPPWTPYPPIPSSSAEMAQAGLRLMMPGRFPTGLRVPVVAWVERTNGAAARVNGSLGCSANAPIAILRGVGSGFLAATNTPGRLVYELKLRQLGTSKAVEVEATSWQTNGPGTLNTVSWPEHSRIAITGNVTIPTGATVTVGAGSVITLGPGCAISLNGRMVIEGTEDEPVVFCPALSSLPWGGFYLTNSSSVLEATGAIFTGSGADPDAVPQSHRNEQCLFFLDNHARLSLTNCAAMSLAGQFGHGTDRGQPWNEVILDHTLVQRCTTGGEWNGSSIKILQSAIVEVPAVTPVFNNGDEDGIYFTTGQYEVRDSLIGWTRDDGLDAGSGGTGTVTVSNTWVEATYHEGFAWSGGNRLATNWHTVTINCGQGIECGYSTTENSPLVYVNDSFSTANAIGARFGDNYDWTYNGFIRVTNSLLLYNYRDVWGVNWDDWTYRTNAMDVQGNLVSQVNWRHPDNELWQPSSQAERLAGFMTTPADAPVGIGLALWKAQLTVSATTNPVPVRLSSFTTKPVSADYRLETADQVLAAGTVSFAPGETVQMIPPLDSVPAGAGMMRLTLVNPTNAEITGERSAWFLEQTSTANQALVPFGATWRYLDTGTNAGTVWRDLAFDDSGWKSGAAELGYGDSRDGRPEATQLSYGTDSNNKYITYYFRHAFEVADPSVFRGLLVQLRRDDGGIVYLNGKEIFRSNMPIGPADYLTRAEDTANDDGTSLFSTNAPASTLAQGHNVLAVEIHQDSPTSSDISFDLQLEAVTPPSIGVNQFGQDLVLTWDQADAVLESATELDGVWTETRQNSPTEVKATEGKRFYRLRQLSGGSGQ